MHLWKDCHIMREFKNSDLFRYDHGPSGGSSPGFHGPGYGGGSSNSGFQNNQGNQNNQGGNHQQGNQGNQQQSGYQSNPKQLNSGQYHVDQKLHKKAVNSIEPAVSHYLCWSEQPTVWSRVDHPPRVDNPGHLALVVAPQVGGYKFTKVLMDGGSSINILYYETFRRMGLTDKNLKPSNHHFSRCGAW